VAWDVTVLDAHVQSHTDNTDRCGSP